MLTIHLILSIAVLILMILMMTRLMLILMTRKIIDMVLAAMLPSGLKNVDINMLKIHLVLLEEKSDSDGNGGRLPERNLGN